MLCIESLVLGDNEFATYSEKDPILKEVVKGINTPSKQSDNVTKDCIGVWYYHHEYGKAKVTYRFIKMVIAADGNVMFEYQANNSNQTMVCRGKNVFVHKLRAGYPGKRPTMLIEINEKEGKKILPLTDFTVEYDSRVPEVEGKILKFRDLNRNSFVFLKRK